MPSSSTDRREFRPGDAAAWVRLSLVVVLGAGALVVPAIGLTGAIYTDSATVGFDVYSSPAPTTTTTTTAAPVLAPAPLAAPAMVTAPVSSPTPTPSPTPEVTAATATPTPSPTATPAPTTSPTATAPTGQGRSRTLWPVWPQPRGQ